MTLKKSELYSSLWSSCDELRGGMDAHFAAWQKRTAVTLKGLKAGCKPKEIIAALAEDLLAHYAGKPLINNSDMYQLLMNYWAETMQDDVYRIAALEEKLAKTRRLKQGMMQELLTGRIRLV